MTAPFVGEIKIFGFNFPPRNWAFCNGQLIAISQNTALFSILGTYYGGNGQSNFALPNMQGSSPISSGQGAGLSDYVIGEQVGEGTVTLLSTEMPTHTHLVNSAISNPPVVAQQVRTPGPTALFSSSGPGSAYSVAATPAQAMAPQAIGLAGGNQPHQNRQPYLAMNFCIALYGIFPTRN